MKMPRRTAWRFLLGAALFGALVWLERRRPARPRREPKLRRDTRNLALAGLSAISVTCCESLVLAPLLKTMPERRWGLLGRLRPCWPRRVAALVLMDYTLYLWHVLVHRVPFLWRFHAVHHVDLDMDASTALRFHFGEMILSVPYRALQVLAIGVDQPSFLAWQTFLAFCILFHHSNLELPPRWERRIGALLTTPRMHALHHAAQPELAACNWSSGLSVWDRLHRTLRWQVAQPRIGVQGIDRPDQVGVAELVVMPFDPPQSVTDYGRAVARLGSGLETERGSGPIS